MDGDRGYEPIKPRSGLGDLLRKLAAPIVALGFLIVKFGGFLLKFKVVTTGRSMLVSSRRTRGSGGCRSRSASCS